MGDYEIFTSVLLDKDLERNQCLDFFGIKSEKGSNGPLCFCVASHLSRKRRFPSRKFFITK